MPTLMQPKTNRSSQSNNNNNHHLPKRSSRDENNIRRRRRVILLLDLDCFYAQCECVRLGFNVITTPLALLQWSSVLAVTYPARTLFDIKRGDTWEDIQKKVTKVNDNDTGDNVDNNGNTTSSNAENSSNTASSNNNNHPKAGETNIKQCYTVSVPLLTASSPDRRTTTKLESWSPSNDNTDKTDRKVSGVIADTEYEEIFCLSKSEQDYLRKQELGVRYYSSDGKASIERYRIASRKIFETVLEWIDENTTDSTDQIILERASIDEFFIDVTDACCAIHNNSKNKNPTNAGNDHDKRIQIKEAMEHTKIVGQSETTNNDSQYHYEDNDDFDDDDGGGGNCTTTHEKLLQIGCHIAYCIRQRVFERLGFTLSAGISCNKTIAKLSTTYGKPNGQAVTFPNGVDYILNNTPIRKCRNLGGKLGKKVIELLPPNVPPTVGSIAKYLSFPDLQKAFPPDDSNTTNTTARWVYEIAHGIDNEQVLSKNESAIPKSITCFKSLPFSKQGHSISDTVRWIRLLADELISRVDRDTIRHHRYPRSCTIQYSHSGWRSKSIRLDFPSQRLLSNEAKIETLIDIVPTLIRSKEGKDFRLNRIGLCAVDFVTHATQSNTIQSYFSSNPVLTTAATLSTIGNILTPPCSTPTSIVKDVQADSSYRTASASKRGRGVESSEVDADYEYAKKLQADLNSHRNLLPLDNSERKTVIDGKDGVLSGGAGKNEKIPKLLAKVTTKCSSRNDNMLSVPISDDNDTEQEDNRDMLLAKKLQATYDSEYRMVGALEKRNSITTKLTKGSDAAKKSRRIDTFFQKR